MESPATTEGGRSRRAERTIKNTAVPILGFVLGLVAFVGLIVVALPNILRSWAESQLTGVFVHTVEIEKLHVNLLTGHIELDVLRVRSNEDHSELAVIRQINADVDLWPLLRRDVSLRRLEVVSPFVHLVRTEDSRWNLPDMGKRGSASDSKAGTSVDIQTVVLRDGSLTIEDRSRSPTQTARMDDIQLTMTDLSLASSNPATIHGSAQVANSGRIIVDGAVRSDVRSGNMKVDLTDVSLATVSGTLSDHVRVQGRVTARLSVTWPGKGSSPVGIAGSLEGHDIAISSAGHPVGHAAAASVSQVEVSWPHRVAMDRLVVNTPKIWIRRNESGHFVGFRAERGDSSKPKPASRPKNQPSYAATTSTQWLIGTIVVRGGIVHLEDRSVTPVYSDVLENLEMRLDEFMTTPPRAMRIAARAEIASGGALDLHGRAALWGPTLSASLKATIRRFVVPSTNPYLERTVSHYTTSGTLASTMDIQLGGDRLDVHSDVILSDLQVEPVRNSTRQAVQERIGLPLGLLIALLKDEAGRIVITFPISGPLSNPTFDWTNAIWTTIRHTVVKLITLPIRSIGRLVMGGHRLDEVALAPITFDPGSSTIRPEMERTLHELAKLLRSVNRAVLHITPILSPTDVEALQRLPPASWPVPDLDTPETAGHVLAVRRAYLVAARLAGLKKVPSSRLPVNPPRHDTSEAGRPRVELKLEKTDEANAKVHVTPGMIR